MAPRPGRSVAVAVGGGLLAGSVMMAFAASLGNLNVQTIGASSNVIASCDTVGGIDVSWNDGASPVYSGNANANLSTYNITMLKLSNVDAACDTLRYKLTLADNTGAVVGAEATGTISLVAGVDDIPIPTPANSKNAVQITLVIYG